MPQNSKGWRSARKRKRNISWITQGDLIIMRESELVEGRRYADISKDGGGRPPVTILWKEKKSKDEMREERRRLVGGRQRL